MTGAPEVAAALGAEVRPPNLASRPRLVLVLGAGLAIAAFLALQIRELRMASGLLAEGDAWRFQAAFWLMPYLCIVATAAIAGAAGVSRLALVPPVAYVAIGWSELTTGSAGVLGSWNLDTGTARLAGFALAVLPCAAIAVVVRPVAMGVPAWRDSASAAALGLGVVVVILASREIIAGTRWDTNLDLLVLGLVAGMAASCRRTLRPIALVVAVLPHPGVLSAVASLHLSTIPVDELVVATLVVAAGALWLPAAHLASTLAERTTTLFVVVNGLNVADALATFVAAQQGSATEANPVVAAIGLPAKIGIVLVATHLLRRHRPQALMVPAVVLTVVLAWHLAGLVI